IVEDCLKELQVSEVVWIASKNGKYYQIYFTVDLYDNDATLQYLQEKGIGVEKHTSVGYIPFGLFYCNEDEEEEEFSNGMFGESGNFADTNKTLSGFKKLQNNFLKSVTSRLTVMQVVEGVRSSSELTFDFVMYTFFAGCIAAAGLLNNSAVDVAAAMMIEPVMATVMAMTFGLVIHDRGLFALGFINCCISLFICVFVGFVYGLIALIWSVEWNPPPNSIWPTPEMQVRGLYRTLWYGALQALAAGGAIAVTLLNNNQAALVGVAVASTFLPPFINSGLLWAYAIHLEARGAREEYINVNVSNNEIVPMKPSWVPQPGYVTVHYFDMRYECVALGGVSLLYTLVNVVCMLIAAYLILRIKEIIPLGKMETNRRFFKEDIKIARSYNRKSTIAMNSEQFGKQILGEWADIAGLDANQLLSEKPEAEVTRVQTLKDIIEEIEGDDTYRSVTRAAVGSNFQANLKRRLTQANIKQSQTNAGFEDEEGVFDIERSAGERSGQRRFSVFPGTRRKSSRWAGSTPEDVSRSSLPVFANVFVNYTLQHSPEATIHSGQGSISELSVRGLKPTELASIDRRRSSVLLRKSLQDAEHSPFSIWPSSDVRKSSATPRYQPNEVRRRMSHFPRRSTQGENTRF
ncbi:hypothetical protein B4U80_11055, partial [Leptotrombidium deliense]